jgi:hypothetical protein
MSGLQSYYDATQNYASNLSTAQNYLDNYDNEFYDNWKNKVEDLREQGKAYMELGGAIEGTYVGAKAVKSAYSAWKAKYGGKGDGNEDGDGKGDDEGEGDDNDRGGDDDDGDLGEAGEEGAGEEGADASELASQYLGGGVADTGSGGSIPLQDFSTPQEGAEQPAPIEAGEEEFGDGQLGEQPGAEGDIRAPAPEDPSPPTDPEPDLSVDVGQGPANQGGELAGDVGETTGTELGTELGTEGATEASGAVLGALGVASEAIPVVGGLVALGIGLYEIFHHHDKPKPPPAPQNTVSQKGEMVVPSFDSVTDTPASQSAF